MSRVYHYITNDFEIKPFESRLYRTSFNHGTITKGKILTRSISLYKLVKLLFKKTFY
jgi:hypothetical protein